MTAPRWYSWNHLTETFSTSTQSDTLESEGLSVGCIDAPSTRITLPTKSVNAIATGMDHATRRANASIASQGRSVTWLSRHHGKHGRATLRKSTKLLPPAMYNAANAQAARYIQSGCVDPGMLHSMRLLPCMRRGRCAVMTWTTVTC